MSSTSSLPTEEESRYDILRDLIYEDFKKLDLSAQKQAFEALRECLPYAPSSSR